MNRVLIEAIDNVSEESFMLAVLEVGALARSELGSESRYSKWVNMPNDQLDNRTPLAAILSGDVLQVLDMCKLERCIF